MEFSGPLARPSSRALYGRYGVQEFGEDRGVVDVGPGKHHRERHAIGVGDDVALGAALTSVYGVGTGLLAPFLAGMLAESSADLEKSIKPALPISSSKAQ